VSAWVSTLEPDTYSVMAMGYPDYGGGPEHEHGGAAVSVADLTGPQDGTPDVDVELDARQEHVHLASGEVVDGYTLNGTSPGPLIEATQGDLVQVTLVNVDVPDGITLHWHGVDVPNAEDGVAGVTQDVVEKGGRYVYRFVVADAGTYWYHSHQVSHEQVRGGLFGTLVVHPADGSDAAAGGDVVAPVHNYGGHRTVRGATGITEVEAPEGSPVRVRLVNTDDGPLRTWVTGKPFRVVAVDGADLNGPTDVRGEGVLVTAGGRMDVLVTSPARIDVGGGVALVVGPPGTSIDPDRQPAADLDLLSYGTPAPLPFDTSHPDRRFDYDIGRRWWVVDGRPGFWWTVNGHLWPDLPMFHVQEGDVVVMTIRNDSGDVHPMHLHGHHAFVLSRDGVATSGSPWRVDSLNVRDGETYEIAFLADNPGVWMDHCHNLQHAEDGLIAHLAYAGVTEPFLVGGDAGNEPE
jgi:FtsP/CotA-like multicopper oxidase with cupredoxin domain